MAKASPPNRGSCWKQSGANGEQLHRVQHWRSIGAEMLANLQAATDVGAGDQLRSSSGKISGFELAQGRGFFWLHQVVDPSAAAAHTRFCGFAQLQFRDGAQ